MQNQPKAKIFLAEERGYYETDWYRTYSSFNFDKYENRHKQPFARLYVLNDETLAGGRSVKHTIEENSIVLLIPIVGAIIYKDKNRRQAIVNAGKLQILNAYKGDIIELINPYENELVNFLQVWIKSPVLKSGVHKFIDFKLDENENKLVPLTLNFKNSLQLYPNLLMGKFQGREEAIYKPSDKFSSVFVFVIQGVFEVQGRLLQQRDGLGLWDNLKEIEIEALSNEAIILLVELNNVSAD